MGVGKSDGAPDLGSDKKATTHTVYLCLSVCLFLHCIASNCRSQRADTPVTQSQPLCTEAEHTQSPSSVSSFVFQIVLELMLAKAPSTSDSVES